METGLDLSLSMNMVASELVRGKEITRKLLAHIDSGCSIETCRALASEMLSLIDKSILMVKSSVACDIACPNSATADSTESPRPLAKSLGGAFEVQQRREMFKKRKPPPKSTNRVRLGTGPGAEGPADDGYSWRKYGQKEILGAKHPRGYYRCTHRKSQGCLAMKQVQRSDDNPLLFDVTYRSTHTCQRKSSSAHKINGLPARGELHHQNQNILLNFQTSLKVKTEGLGLNSLEPSPSSVSFSFPSTPVDSMTTEKVTFSPSSTLDKSFLGSLSNAFNISPTTSESNYFSMSWDQMSSYGGHTLQAAESDFTDAATSASNSPILDMGFLLDSVDFDQDFPFDTSSFLPQTF